MSAASQFIRASVLAVTALVVGCGNGGTGPAASEAVARPAVHYGPASLVAAYPDFVAQVTDRELILRDGTRFPLFDGIAAKTPAQRLARPDIEDMFVDRYVPGPPGAPPGADYDPGRVRYQPFFDHMYGDCRAGAVVPHLRAVQWLPGRGGRPVMVTRVNGVAEHLEAVVRDLALLPDSMTRYLVPSAGTYNCRTIAGTEQRSMHSYGVAIDISTAYSDYWRWSGGAGVTPRYRNRIPFEIVAVFERHGFIWGGKWSHFDTMHFEYRPELLPPH